MAISARQEALQSRQQRAAVRSGKTCDHRQVPAIGSGERAAGRATGSWADSGLRKWILVDFVQVFA